MQIVKKVENKDGCYIGTSYSMYLSKSEYLDLVRLLCQVSVMDADPPMEVSRLAFIDRFKDHEKIHYQLMLDELTKVI